MGNTRNRTRFSPGVQEYCARNFAIILRQSLRGERLWGGMLFALLLIFSPQQSLGQSSHPETLTLHQAVQFALQHSPDLQGASAEIRRREGVAKTTRSPLCHRSTCSPTPRDIVWTTAFCRGLIR